MRESSKYVPISEHRQKFDTGDSDSVGYKSGRPMKLNIEGISSAEREALQTEGGETSRSVLSTKAAMELSSFYKNVMDNMKFVEIEPANNDIRGDSVNNPELQEAKFMKKQDTER